jgi:hypothetical protein
LAEIADWLLLCNGEFNWFFIVDHALKKSKDNCLLWLHVLFIVVFKRIKITNINNLQAQAVPYKLIYKAYPMVYPKAKEHD